MTKILIVEGNTAEIVLGNRDAGIQEANERYRDTLRLHDKEIETAASIPFAPHLQETDIDVREFDAFALTGSGIIWSAGAPEAAPYMEHLAKIVATGKPIIGSCWGMQTVVQIMGGDCLPNEKGTEVGLAENIELTAKGRAHWIFEGMPERFSSPCVHRDHVVSLPDCFDLLASNPVSPVQAVSCHSEELDYVGFQFHPEFDLELARTLFTNSVIHTDKENQIASFPENPPEIVTNEMLRTRVFENWLRYVRNKKAATGIAA